MREGDTIQLTTGYLVTVGSTPSIWAANFLFLKGNLGSTSQHPLKADTDGYEINVYVPQIHMLKF